MSGHFALMPPSVSTRDSRKATQVTLRAVLLLSGALTIVFLISFVFSDRGISDLQQSRRRVAELHSEITQLARENVRLQAEIESAKKSTFSVERIAREDLGMARKGEIIYMLPKKK